MKLRLLLIAALFTAVTAQLSSLKLRGYRTRSEARDNANQLQNLMQNNNMDSLRTLYKKWKMEMKKTYADGSSEDKLRFQNWLSNLNSLVANNKQTSTQYFKGLSQFGDMTFAEFRVRYLMTPRPVIEAIQRIADAPVLKFSPTGRKLQQSVPLEFDWRTTGKVPRIRDQGPCGSCWAFAGVGALEIKASIDNTATLPDLSEQQLVDCLTLLSGFLSFGCNGGWTDQVLRYASNNWLSTEAAYPYNASNQACKVSSSTTPPTGALTVRPFPGFTAVPANPAAIMAAVSTVGPVVTYFNVQSSFMEYTTGVYQASQCDASGTVNHAMVIVGYNATAGVGSPDSYWLIRNSWGNWGDQGYVKVQMTNDAIGACRMYSGLLLPGTTAPPTTEKPCKGLMIFGRCIVLG